MKQGFFHAVDQALTRFNWLCATIGGLVLLFITVALFTDVFLRYFFNSPSVWITEVSSYLFLYVIFLGASYALQQGMHIRVSFIADRFKGFAGWLLNFFTHLFSLIFTVVLLYEGSVMTWEAYTQNWTTPTMLNMPYVYVPVAIVLGSFFLLLTILLQTILLFQPGETDMKGDEQ